MALLHTTAGRGKWFNVRPPSRIHRSVTIVVRRGTHFTSGQMSAILGHAHPEIVATVRERVAHLAHLHRSLRLYKCCHVTRAFRYGLWLPGRA